MALTRINNQALPTLEHSKLPSGSTLQVVTSTFTGSKQYTSNTYTASGLKVNITPKYSTSKILILCDIGMVNCHATSSTEVMMTIYRDSTNLDTTTYGHFFRGANSLTGYAPVSIMMYDSPATTSQITYELYGRSGNTQGVYAPHSSTQSQITVMEIAG